VTTVDTQGQLTGRFSLRQRRTGLGGVPEPPRRARRLPQARHIAWQPAISTPCAQPAARHYGVESHAQQHVGRQVGVLSTKQRSCRPHTSATGSPQPMQRHAESAQPGTRRGSQRKLTSPRRAVPARRRVRTHAPPTEGDVFRTLLASWQRCELQDKVAAPPSANPRSPGRGAHSAAGPRRCRPRWRCEKLRAPTCLPRAPLRTQLLVSRSNADLPRSGRL
jgi:hypothetical protein